MRNIVKRTVAPTLRPISVDEAKLHFKVTGTDEDANIAIYLDGAIAACENKLQTAIMDSTFVLYARNFAQHLSLQKNYVSSITSVKYYDTNGSLTTVSSINYSLQDFKVPNVLYFNNDYTFPNTDSREFPVEVTFQAGFTSASSVFPVIRTAVFLEVADRYENRQNEVIGERLISVMYNTGAEQLLNQECQWL
jgi:uncharacterized phiE125 gp8 family phage protein